MDGYSGKRVVGGGRGLPRNSGLSFREVNHEVRSSQSCNRIGCSTRHSSTKSIQNNDPEKLKYLKPQFDFTNNNSLSASSSRLFSSSNNLRKYYHERKNKASVKEADVAESSTRQSEVGEDFKSVSGFHSVETGHFKDLGRPMLRSLSTISESSNGSSARFGSKYGKQINRRFGSVLQDTTSSLLRRSSSPKFANQVPKTILHGISGRPQRYSLSNLGCASISDVLPSDSSSGCITRGVSVGRKLQYGEGSSKTILSQPEHQVPQEVSRQNTNQSSRDIVVSVKTRRGSSCSQNCRMGSSKQEDESIIQLAAPLLLPHQHHDQLSISDDVQKNTLRSLSTELPSAFKDSSSTGSIGSASHSSQNRLISRSEDRDDYRRFSMEEIAEVLLALERIEQDLELTDEQLSVLEASLFLGSFRFSDQHSDMRLDIDNMSYEELLALEEKMGTVSTALSEKDLSKCLKRSIFRSSITFPGISCHGDDVKCSICQEEYLAGVEVGRLPCEHRFHVECIRQWLGLKNWCPICKVAAASSGNEPQSS